MTQLPRLSQKEAIVLELLAARGEMYGLELVERSDGRLKRGTVYVTLGRMEDKGLVHSHLEKTSDSQGPPRRFYEMTGLGGRLLFATKAAERAFSEFDPLPPLTAALATVLTIPATVLAIPDVGVDGVDTLWQGLLLPLLLVIGMFVLCRIVEAAWQKVFVKALQSRLFTRFERRFHGALWMILAPAGILVAALDQFFGLPGREGRPIVSVENRSRVQRAPGGGLRSMARLLFTKRTYTLVFEPLLADMHLEYCEALADGALRKATWIRMKYTCAFFAVALGRIPAAVGWWVRIALGVG